MPDQSSDDGIVTDPEFVEAVCTIDGCDHTVLTCPQFTAAQYKLAD